MRQSLTRRLTGLGIVALLGAATAHGFPPVPGDPPPKKDDPEDKARASQPDGVEKPPRRIEFDRLPLEGGPVVEVTKAAITIRTAKGVLTFPFHDALAAGGVQKSGDEVSGYRAKDVLVGDVVWLGIWTENEKKFCAEISIRKRPAGRVPESPIFKSLKPSYAVRQNAENDLKDFGIPIPENCKSVFLRPQTEEQLKKDREMVDELLRDLKALKAKMEKDDRDEERKKLPPPTDQ